MVFSFTLDEYEYKVMADLAALFQASRVYAVSKTIPLLTYQYHSEFSDKVQSIQWPTIVHFETEVSASKEFASDMLKKKFQGNVYQALLEYNKEFLRGNLLGAFYHHGPLYADQSDTDLVKLHDLGVFTHGGQGRLCDAVIRPLPARMDLTIGVPISRLDALSTIRSEDVEIDPTLLPPELQSEMEMQKAYLICIMPRKLAEKAMQMPPSEFYVQVFNSTGMLAMTPAYPEETILTLDGMPIGTPESKFSKYTFSVGGSRFDAEETLFQETNMRKVVDGAIGAKSFDRMWAENDLVHVKIEEQRWCQGGKSLTASLLDILK